MFIFHLGLFGAVPAQYEPLRERSGEFRVVFLLFFLVFTVLRTAVNSDFVYSFDGMLCNLSGRFRDRIFPLSIGLSLSVVLVDTWIVERMTKVFTASAPSTISLLAANASVARKCRSSQVFSQQDPRNTFPEHYKVRRSHQQEIVRRMSCCQAARICSKGLLRA